MNESLDHFLAVLLEISTNVCAARVSNNPPSKETTKIQLTKDKLKHPHKKNKTKSKTTPEGEEEEERKQISLFDIKLSLKILGIEDAFPVSLRDPAKRATVMNNCFLE